MTTRTTAATDLDGAEAVLPKGRRQRLHGHLWTVLPSLRDSLRTPSAPTAEPIAIPIHDDHFGPIELTGDLRVPTAARDLVVITHGLGSSNRSSHVLRATRSLHKLGLATLALNLRGADRRGHGYYHVALTADLEATCGHPRLAEFRRLYVLGFSMGGHLALHYAARPSDPRLSGVAAICTPLDLGQAQRFHDRSRNGFYRRYVLNGLKDIYRAVGERQPLVPTPVDEVLRCDTFYDWDRLAIVPRYGFADPESYYREASAANVLPSLQVPCQLVLASADPVVPPALSLPFVDTAPRGMLQVDVRRTGGHLYLAGGDVATAVARQWLAAN
jgi:predicted alpha/beta-fold hydrolase